MTGTKRCWVTDCGKKDVYAQGLCKLHYYRTLFGQSQNLREMYGKLSKRDKHKNKSWCWEPTICWVCFKKSELHHLCMLCHHYIVGVMVRAKGKERNERLKNLPVEKLLEEVNWYG